jgi:hypothetical protein
MDPARDEFKVWADFPAVRKVSSSVLDTSGEMVEQPKACPNTWACNLSYETINIL